ncbi:Extracellular metalloproteinase 9 [Myotisia sp. PD_48]|nr:Extracellular metalloproteinase 9 [Myotisia sp. PD_48]
MHGLLLAGLLLPLNAVAHPGHQSSGLSRRGVDVEAYRLPLKTKFANSKKVSQEPPSFRAASAENYVETATNLVKEVVPGATFRVVSDHYVGTNGIAHVNFRQTVHGIDIGNADFNVNIDEDGKVFSYGNSFYTGKIPKSNPLLKRDFSDPVAALKGASESLNLQVTSKNAKATPAKEAESFVIKGTSGALSDPKAVLMYFIKGDGRLALTWRVETDIGDNWLLSFVDAKDNKNIHGVVDYVASAEFQVYPWGVNDPTDGQRTIVTDPWNITASEFTWFGDSASNKYTTTRGNNAIAQENPTGGNSYLNNYRPNKPDLKFNFPYTTSMSPPSSYRDASITQLFYTSNMFHDLMHAFGFNERAGNFEQNNNGQGGAGNDFAILNAQDGSGTNNANFATPPDGQPGRMRMYTWTTASPQRDGCFDQGIVIHEFAHGLSNRLTGGPQNSNCLNALESGGMGEGWGDFLATAVRTKKSDTRNTNYAMAPWPMNKAGGIRQYVYSTSTSTNPLVYTSVNGMTRVHDIGTVWASILYEVMWNLIDKHGNSGKAMPTFNGRVPNDGRHLAMKLVVDGMALQPCNPNFVQARDAIIDADKKLTGGQNACELWKGFAKRGLGQGAVYNSSRRTGSNTVPTGVC